LLQHLRELLFAFDVRSGRIEAGIVTGTVT